jgi:hypothetical protein
VDKKWINFPDFGDGGKLIIFNGFQHKQRIERLDRIERK